MPNTDQPAPAKPEELNFIRSDRFVKIYANNALIEASIWDIRVTFGEMTISEGKTTVEQLVAVVMSPHHAKALASVLTNHIEKYEQSVGEIKLPPRDDGPKPAKEVAPPAKP